ncbi:hypothetical protein N9E23_01920 [Candidatus Pelagibacter sp.]|jgi:hypothetical protein|nr:hypothetical protein [Candidatus Pelagibacter sp.]
MNKLFLKMQLSKYRCNYVKFQNQSTILKLSKLINLAIDKKLDLNSSKDLMGFSINDFELLNNIIKNSYQKKIINIIKKDIDFHCNKIFGYTGKEFRVGVQLKHIWNKTEINKKGKSFYNKNGGFRESLHKPNFCYPTRPHQDLNNNGFRSSSVIIFYIPLTKSLKNSSYLEVAKFDKTIGLLDFKKIDNYQNQIKKKVSLKLNWNKPKKLQPGYMILMDSLTIHRSSSLSEIPRIALNVKIQPQNINYIFKNFKIKKTNNLRELINSLEGLSKKINSYNFELSVALYLNNEFTKSKNILRKLFLFKCDDTLLKKVMAGAFLKKDLKIITKQDYLNVFKKSLKVEKFSCAYSILNTINNT